VCDSIYTTETVTLLTVCVVILIMTYSSSSVIITPHKTTRPISERKLAPDGHLTELVCDGHPACIRDPASIRTSDQDPWLVMGIGLLFGTRLVLEVLRYIIIFFN